MKKKPAVNIIGAGIGGLSVGACLARNGVQVRLFESLNQVGGVVHTFKRRGYRFEASTHQIGGHGDIGYLTSALDHLGLSDLEVLRAPHLYEACYLDDDSNLQSRFLVSSTPEQLIRDLSSRFPGEERRIREYLETICKIAVDVLRLKRVQRERSKLPILRDAITALWLKDSPEGSLRRRLGVHSYRHLVEHYNLTWDQLLEGFPEELRSVLTQYWAYAGTPPSVAPAVLMAIITYVYLFGGPFHVKGGTIVLVNRLRDAITANGGEIHLKTPIDRIIVDGGRARGVVTAKGVTHLADATISNISSQRTLLDMVGEEHLPAEYVETIKGLTLSKTAFQTFVGAKLDFRDHGFEADTTFFNHGYDAEEQARRADEDPSKPGSFMVTNYSGLDKSYAPEGASSFVVVHFDKYDRWKDLSKEEYARQKQATEDALLDNLERATKIPIREKAEVIFSGTPLTFQRYSSGTQAEIYGPAATLDQCFTKRTAPETPISGLHLVGAYTQPIHGVSAVLDSGVILGNQLLGKISSRRRI